MQILLVDFFFFLTFPTPFCWRLVSISAGVGHPDNSDFPTHWGGHQGQTLCDCSPRLHLGPVRHLLCLFLAILLPVMQAHQDPAGYSNCTAPVHFTLSVGGSNLLCPALTGSALTIPFPGGERARDWDCPRPVGTHGEKKHTTVLLK